MRTLKFTFTYSTSDHENATAAANAARHTISEAAINLYDPLVYRDVAANTERRTRTVTLFFDVGVDRTVATSSDADRDNIMALHENALEIIQQRLPESVDVSLV